MSRAYRISRTLLLGLVGLAAGLSACSLAEDITPPPGYVYSTPVPALQEGSATPAAATETPVATQIPQATTQPAPSQSAATGSAASTPAAAIILKGKVTNATSGTLETTPLTAHLYLYNSSSSAIDQSLTAEVASTGDYRFENVPADANVTYFVMVDYGGVTYASDPISYDGSFTSKDVPLTVYDATSDLSQLTVSQVHLQFDIPTGTQVEARCLYILSNLGNKSVVVESDGRHVPFIQMPSGATNEQYELAQGGTALARADKGFALLPGAEKQYGIIATYDLPYTGNLPISQPFSLSVASATILVPVGVRVKSDLLTDAGVQNFNGTNYHLYQGGNLATDSTLTLTLSGKPGASSGLTSGQPLPLLILLLAAGVLLIGLGIFLLRRGRLQAAMAEAGAGGESTPLLAEDRDTIIDAIIALDDQYKGACITRDVYQKRRDELKRRLKELL